MSRLIVRFDDLNLDSFSWVVTETEDDSVAVDWQDASASALAQLANAHHQLTLVIPQQHVYLTSFDLPDKASRQVLSSIEYQIEDQLAQDVEHQHFAIGNPSSNPLPIAVVEKSIMHDCLALMRKQGLVATQIIAEMFLCPWFGNPGDVCLLECKDGVILRYGEYQAIKCRSDLTQTMLDHLAAEQELQIVNYYLQDLESFPSIQVSEYPGAPHELSLKQLNPGNASVINMLQREFQVTSLWSKLASVWRWILALAFILLAVTAFNRAIALNDLEAQVSAVKASQYELLKDYLPANTEPSADLKKILIDLLKQNQSSGNEVSFLTLLQEFTRAKKAFSSVTISKIGYQNERLSVDVTSNQLSEVEALLAVLEKSGQGVVLEKLSIKPNLVSGQFVMEGG